MKPAMQFLLYALLAVFAENLVLEGGMGTGKILRAARRPKQLFLYGLLVSFFTLCSSFLSLLFKDAFLRSPAEFWLRPLVYAACAAAVYALVAALLFYLLPAWYEKLGKLLSGAAINCVVLAVPFLAQAARFNFFQTAGFALGTGAGFMLAVWLTAEGLRRIDNVNMPKAFLGLPAIFLYLSILSMVFLGFTGGSMFGW